MATGPLPTETEFAEILEMVHRQEHDFEAPTEEYSGPPQEPEQLGPTPDTKWSEPKPEVKPRQYNTAILCMCHQHCDVQFMDGEIVRVNTFDELEALCQTMDEKSAKRLRNDVLRFQAEGKLQELLSYEANRAKQKKAEHYVRQQQDEQARQAAHRNLLNRAKKLDERFFRAEVKALSNQGLAKFLTDRLEDALNEAKLNPVFEKMAEKGMTISIIVDDETGEDIVRLVLNPQNLISDEDVSEELAELESEKKDLETDILMVEMGLY